MVRGLGVSERRACRVLGQPRAVQRYAPHPRDDEAPLTGRIVELAGTYGRYGYRRVTALLHDEAWRVNHKRVERIWRHAGLKGPRSSPGAGVCGSTTEAASGCDRSGGITCGRTRDCADARGKVVQDADAGG